MKLSKLFLFSLLFLITSAWAKININTATISELETLKGIGEKKAARIITYREQIGSFKSVEDLLQVSGIGEKTLENIRDEIEVSGISSTSNKKNNDSKNSSAVDPKKPSKETPSKEAPSKSVESKKESSSSSSQEKSIEKSTKDPQEKNVSKTTEAADTSKK